MVSTQYKRINCIEDLINNIAEEKKLIVADVYNRLSIATTIAVNLFPVSELTPTLAVSIYGLLLDAEREQWDDDVVYEFSDAVKEKLKDYQP
jgi:hypothetical protein